MKWFKHISDSLDDPFIFELMTEFKSDGYLVFFGILEIYSREFKTELGWKLRVTRDYLKQKLQKRQDTLIINCLKHIKNSGKWEIEFKDNQVIIFIPKFTEIIDEWTARKIGSKSGVAPKILTHDKEEEEEVYKDKEEKDKKDVFVLPEYIPKETWKAYLELRKRKKAASTNYALSLIIKKLEKIQRENNQDPVDVLNKSIESGWTGVFPLKDYIKKQPKNNLTFEERQKIEEEKIRQAMANP